MIDVVESVAQIQGGSEREAEVKSFLYDVDLGM